MPSTNKTDFLKLSQFEGGDCPKWLADYNGDMRAIDQAMAGLNPNVKKYYTKITGNLNEVTDSGWYYASTEDTENCPPKAGSVLFALVVRKMFDTLIIQDVYFGGLTQYRYTRICRQQAGGAAVGWGDWELIPTSGVLKTYLPVGSILTWATATAPTGFLLCNGQAVSRTKYATLFALLQTTYGVGDGTTTFNLPNLSGRVVLGASTSRQVAVSGGSETQELIAAVGAVQGNTGTIGYKAASAPPFDYDMAIEGTGTVTAGTPVTANHGAMVCGMNGETPSNLPPFLTLNYIIKAETGC